MIRLPLLFICLLLLLSLPVTALAQSQMEMNEKAEADFENADSELNRVYHKLFKSIDDPEIRQELVAAQKAWLKFRDAEATLEADENKGGSIMPMVYSMSRTEMTQARTAQLREVLRSFTDH